VAGYSSTPLVKKLGIKPGAKIFIVNPPREYFDWIFPLPENVDIKTKALAELDFIHVFAREKKTFEQEFRKAQKHLKSDGMLWISWPKKSSKMETDLDENIIRNFGLKEGLVDVKVCAVDDTWSGLKFVVRIKDR
jgi:hypothetical protein